MLAVRSSDRRHEWFFRALVEVSMGAGRPRAWREELSNGKEKPLPLSRGVARDLPGFRLLIGPDLSLVQSVLITGNPTVLPRWPFASSRDSVHLCTRIFVTVYLCPIL